MNHDLTHLEIPSNGVVLHAVECGRSEGKLIVLLHGFPDFWYGWRHQIQFLASQGYRVVAPDQRGYNLSSKPKEVAAYNIDHLAEDAVSILTFFERKKAIFVGHDWGGIVAWRIANRFPEIVDHLIVINVPHPAVLKRTLRKSWKQRFKSWYMFAFQIPWLPEFFLGLADQYSAKLLRKSSLPGTFTDSDLFLYRKSWSQPGGLRGAIHWYRALFRTRALKLSSPRIQVHTLLIWGAKDSVLDIMMTQPSIDLCDNGTLQIIQEGTHWVHQEFPERVNELIIQFCRDQENY